MAQFFRCVGRDPKDMREAAGLLLSVCKLDGSVCLSKPRKAINAKHTSSHSRPWLNLFAFARQQASLQLLKEFFSASEIPVSRVRDSKEVLPMLGVDRALRRQCKGVDILLDAQADLVGTVHSLSKLIQGLNWMSETC